MKILKVLIPKGDMPKDCRQCDHCNYIEWESGEYWFVCGITEHDIPVLQIRDLSCPLVEVEDGK